MGELAPGSTFAGHRIEEIAGRGGMGVVYRATHLGLERTVALKVIAAQYVADEAFRERFKRESKLAAGIDHPNVVPVYEAGEEDGSLYISMRYVDGVDLGKVIAGEGRLEPSRAVAIVDQVAYALDAAHEAGLIHRDVKPANALIEQRPRGEHASLTDFGLTKRADAKSGMTGTGVFVGTIDYIAPEQLEGKAPLDARADIYSLGCVLYHALTGGVPYERDNQIATMFAHATEAPPSAREAVPEVPVALDEVVRRAMAKAPGDRYPSAGDFGRAALAALGGGSVSRAERSVATGAAAPSGVGATPPPSPPAPPPAAPPAPEPTAPARAQEPPDFSLAPGETDPAPAGGRSRRDQRHSRAFAIGAVLAFVALIALAVILFTSGGGGDDGPSADETAEADIRASIDGAREAALNEDAEGFCGYLSSGVIATLEANGDLNDTVPTCADLVGANSSSVAEAAASEPEITDIAVTGDTARVTGELGGSGEKRFVELGAPVIVGFTNEDGTWKLDELPDTG